MNWRRGTDHVFSACGGGEITEVLAEGWFVDRKIGGERNSSVDGIDIIQKASPLMV